MPSFPRNVRTTYVCSNNKLKNMSIAAATFTLFDESQASACVNNRNILYQLWDLAMTYPNIASKIEVRIRQADPLEDYMYDDSMSDAAIVVTLKWFDTVDACRFFRCHGSYPTRDGRVDTAACAPNTEPRVYPSGDSSTLTSCEPACFFATNAKRLATANSTNAAPTHTELQTALYSSDEHYIMSVRNGRYTSHKTDRTDAITTTAAATVSTNVVFANDASGDKTMAPDLVLFEYVPESATCEVANYALIDYITQPRTRSERGDECRVNNFAIGEDVVEGARVDGSKMLPKIDDVGDRVSTLTGRVSSSYCSAFAKKFDPVARDCDVPWWETALSYTFLGSALIRLARHAAHGGDGCNEIFPASPSRAETSSKNVDKRLLSRSEWFDDVDRAWVCPPPNVLLSDLNVHSKDDVWTNRNGGSVVRAVPSDYASAFRQHDNDATTLRRRQKRQTITAAQSAVPPYPSSSSVSDTDCRSIARAILQRWRRRRLHDIEHVDENAPIAVKISRRRRDVSEPQSSSLLDFDKIYTTIRDKRGNNGDAVLQMAQSLARELGIISANIVLERWITRLMKSAYNRALRFVGQRLLGTASRTLVALGVRVSAASMLSTALSGVSTRLMLSLGTAATGVGAVIAVVELLSFALDIALMAGWDPGHYNAEKNNDAFDGMALAWLRMRTRERMPRLDPHYALYLHSSTYASAQSAAAPENTSDESSETTPRPDLRFVVRNIDDIPWFFAPFTQATNAMIEDATAIVAAPNDGTNRRVRPVVSDSPVISHMLWTVHYFTHRRVNSNGQRVRVGNDDDIMRIDDDAIHDAIRNNELAAFLNQSTGPTVARERLVGAARRNLVAKGVRLLDHVVAIVATTLGAVVVAGVALALRPTTPSLTAIWLLALALLLVIVPLVLMPATLEMICGPDGGAATTLNRTYDRKNETADLDDLDLICDEFANSLLTAANTDSTFVANLTSPFRAEMKILRKSFAM